MLMKRTIVISFILSLAIIVFLNTFFPEKWIFLKNFGLTLSPYRQKTCQTDSDCPVSEGNRKILPTPSSQGILFQGTVSTGIGTYRDCSSIQDPTEKSNCQRSNSPSTDTPTPVSMKIKIVNIVTKQDYFVTTQAVPNFKIELPAGNYLLCAVDQNGITNVGCSSSIEVREGTFVNYAFPLLKQ